MPEQLGITFQFRRSDYLREIQPAARRTDPQTSHDAAASMKAAATRQCAAVLTVLRDLGVAGAEQIGERLGMPAYAVRKRTSELQRAGLIYTLGDTRKTLSGRSERFWRAC